MPTILPSALGVDIAALSTDPLDIDPYFRLASGPRAVAEAVAASLSHEPGILWWSPDRGTDLRGMLHRDFSASGIAAAVEAEALKDERVVGASATASSLGPGQIRVELELELRGGDSSTVELTLNVDEVAGVLAAVTG